METLYIVLLIIIASLGELMISRRKRRQQKASAQSINMAEEVKGYQHSPLDGEDNPYDFLTTDLSSLEDRSSENNEEILAKSIPKYSLKLSHNCQPDKIPPQQFEEMSSPTIDNRNDILEEFDIRKAVIYSEIIKPKF